MMVLLLSIAILLFKEVVAYPTHSNLPLKHIPVPVDKKEIPTPDPVVQKSVVEIVKPELRCPKNFHIFKDKCVHLAKRPVDFRCQKGFEKRQTSKGVECVREMLQEANMVCEDGFSMSGNTCTRYHDQFPEYRCPELYDLRNRQCILTTAVPPQMQCPTDYRLLDGQCTKLTTMEPTYYCEGDGFELDAEFLRCVGVDWKPLEFVCPSGTIPQRDGTCKGQTRRTVGDACNGGEKLEDGMCVSKDVIEITSVCEGTSPSDQDENCIIERVLPAQQRCPQSYTLNPSTGKCEKVLEAPLEPVCVEGVLDRSTNPPSCKFQESTLPSLLCPEGYLKEDDTCVKETASEPQPLCDQGFQLEDMQCVRDTNVDLEPYCAPGYRPRGDTCVRPKFENAKRTCSIGYEYKFGQCTAVEAIQPDLTCAAGFALDGHTCVSSVRKDPLPLCNCSHCELVGDKCITKEVQSVIPTCKDPFRWNNEKGMCEYSEAVHADAYCPKGYSFNGNSKSSHKAQCTKTETVAPTPTCGEGYRLDVLNSACRSRPQMSQVHFSDVENAKMSHSPPQVQAQAIHGSAFTSRSAPQKTYHGASSTSHGGFLHGWS